MLTSWMQAGWAGRILTSWMRAGRVLTSWMRAGQMINVLDMGWTKNVYILDVGWTKRTNIMDLGWTKALTTTVVQIVLFILVWFVQITVVME